jgi:type IV secretory pathway VirB3-like protein
MILNTCYPFFNKDMFLKKQNYSLRGLNSLRKRNTRNKKRDSYFALRSGITTPTIISTIPAIINGIIYCAYGVLSVLTNPNSWGVVITKAPAIRPIIATTTPMMTKILFIFLPRN